MTELGAPKDKDLREPGESPKAGEESMVRMTEAVKVECARRFFSKISIDEVHYDVVTSYDKLMEIVQ